MAAALPAGEGLQATRIPMAATRAMKGCSCCCRPCAARSTRLFCGGDSGLSVGIACVLPPGICPKGEIRHDHGDQSVLSVDALQHLYFVQEGGLNPVVMLQCRGADVLPLCPGFAVIDSITGIHVALDVVREDIGVQLLRQAFLVQNGAYEQFRRNWRHF